MENDNNINDLFEWSEEFAAEADKLYQLAMSSLPSSSSSAVTQPPPPPYSAASAGGEISYSPPRVLSQRTPDDIITTDRLIKRVPDDKDVPIKAFDPPFSGVDKNSSRAPFIIHGNDRLMKRGPDDNDDPVKAFDPPFSRSLCLGRNSIHAPISGNDRLIKRVPDDFDDPIKAFDPPFSRFSSLDRNSSRAPVNYGNDRLIKRVPDDNDDPVKAFDPPFSGVLGLDRNSSHASVSHGNDRLIKSDSGRAVKQPILREQGSLQVRKVDKKKEPFKPSFPQIELKHANVQQRFGKNLEHQAHTHDTSQLTSAVQNGSSVIDQFGSRITAVTPTFKSIGVQTEKSETSATLPVKNDLFTSQSKRKKLLTIWDSPARQGSERNLVSELLVACETDLGVLFGCLSFSRATTSSLVDQKPPAQSAEADNVLNLYSMLTKIGSGMVDLNSVIEALVDLCRLDNDVILYRSLRVLHKTLTRTCCVDVRPNKRETVVVDGSSSGNNTAATYGFKFRNFSDSSLTEFITGLSGEENIRKKESETYRHVSSTSCLDWFSVSELMRKIAMETSEECIRLEAVSIMNMILIRSHAYVDRERFGRVLGFRTISHLLRKDSTVGLRKEAVRLLYLLLNCPQLMATFCSGCKEEVEKDGNVNTEAKDENVNTETKDENVNAETKNGSTVKEIEYSVILEGLAGCIACDGSSILELKLRRDTVTLLAFLASSGQLGFEILLAQRVSRRSNYLAIILQMLVSELDAEVSSIYQPSETFRARSLLIRETLIFLNRLVSNPQFSTPVLRALTDSRGTACLAVDIANRLSVKTNFCWLSDSMTRQLRESEIVGLAQVFRKRIFTYLQNGSP